MSTHKLYFCGEIRKYFDSGHPFLFYSYESIGLGKRGIQIKYFFICVVGSHSKHLSKSTLIMNSYYIYLQGEIKKKQKKKLFSLGKKVLYLELCKVYIYYACLIPFQIFLLIHLIVVLLIHSVILHLHKRIIILVQMIIS